MKEVKYNCDLCPEKDVGRVDELRGVRDFIREYIDPDVTDVCPECACKIIDGVYALMLNGAEDTVREEVVANAPAPAPKKKGKRTHFSTAENFRFRDTLCKLASTGTYTQHELLDAICDLFPKRLRKSNGSRVAELLTHPEKLTHGTPYKRYTFTKGDDGKLLPRSNP